jgi:hypothetical protein
MSNVIRLSIASCLAIAFTASCISSSEPPSAPPSQAQSSLYDDGAAHFIADALARNAQDASYTYTAASPGAEPCRVVVGVSSTGPASNLLIAASESSVEWCTPASPHVPVSKSIWCQMCNKNDAEDCARQWAFSTADDFCATQISTSDGDEACAPDSFTGDLCVDTSSQGVTSSVQVGSDTACGVWPFRHAAWKVTYNVTGNCGFSCRAAL